MGAFLHAHDVVGMQTIGGAGSPPSRDRPAGNPGGRHLLCGQSLEPGSFLQLSASQWQLDTAVVDHVGIGTATVGYGSSLPSASVKIEEQWRLTTSSSRRPRLRFATARPRLNLGVRFPAMSAFAKKSLFIVSALFLALFVCVVFYLPPGWRSITVGMSRTEITAMLGEPDFASGDIKGCFWFRGIAPVKFELQVFFGPESKVQTFSIRQYLGPSEGSYVRHIQFKNQET